MSCRTLKFMIDYGDDVMLITDLEVVDGLGDL